jgi:hypothetical protein
MGLFPHSSLIVTYCLGQLVEYLNQFVVGQEKAKKVLSVAYVFLTRVIIIDSAMLFSAFSIIITAFEQTLATLSQRC